jgi:uncharacterized protein with GYD domain
MSMTLYMYQASYTAKSLAAQLTDPHDPMEAIGSALEDVGATILVAGFPFGEYDLLVVYEAPDDVTAASVAMAVGAAGEVKSAKTTRLLSGQEWLESLRKHRTVSTRKTHQPHDRRPEHLWSGGRSEAAVRPSLLSRPGAEQSAIRFCMVPPGRALLANGIMAWLAVLANLAAAGRGTGTFEADRLTLGVRDAADAVRAGSHPPVRRRGPASRPESRRFPQSPGAPGSSGATVPCPFESGTHRGRGSLGCGSRVPAALAGIMSAGSSVAAPAKAGSRHSGTVRGSKALMPAFRRNCEFNATFRHAHSPVVMSK